MSELNPIPERMLQASRGIPVLVALFALSGCSALIYEIVWFQLLGLVIGSSAISLGILLGTFMGGMCLGSVAAPRLVSRSRHPLHVYALMELAIGAIGLALLAGMPLVAGIYTSWAGPGIPGVVLRGVIAGLCLLPPTALMGATLPAMARWVEATPQGASWLGLFYGGNIAGAVIGSLLTGFYLLRFHDSATATYVAVALNVIVALLSLRIAKAMPYHYGGVTHSRSVSDPAERPVAGAWAVYVTIALSGMTALAAEVVWTRLLALMFGATVYAFSLILATFLLGLGIGASCGAALGARLARPRAALGWCQLLLCAALAWAAYELAAALPYWTVDAAKAADLWYMMRFDLVRSLWAVLPPAILWGASFPLALAALVERRRADPARDLSSDPGRWVGRVYAANTLGTIVGALAASLWLVASIGSRHTEQTLIAMSAVAGLLALAPLGEDRTTASRKSFTATATLAVLGAILLAVIVPDVPPELIAYGRLVTAPDHAKVIYSAEGLTTSVAVSRTSDGGLNYHSAGKIQASSEYQDMRLQRMLGHLTTLVPENPRRFLVIGLGAGVTAGAVGIEPKREHETIVDIEPLVPRVIAKYFRAQNFDVLAQPHVEMRIDDGRHFLLTTRERFDGITSDPLDPWVKGTAALYTREFFELERRHLNPGGVVTQFVQLYESSEEAVKSEIATFFEVFPDALVFSNNVMGQGYDLVLLGRASPGPIDLDRMEALLDTAEYGNVKQSLEEIGFYSATDLLSTYVAQASDLRPWLQDATINRDRNLRLEYLAGAGLNRHDGSKIFDHMTAFGPRMPTNVFKGSETLLDYLGRAIESGSSRY
jgi:spermidine synthase